MRTRDSSQALSFENWHTGTFCRICIFIHLPVPGWRLRKHWCPDRMAAAWQLGQFCLCIEWAFREARYHNFIQDALSICTRRSVPLVEGLHCLINVCLGALLTVPSCSDSPSHLPLLPAGWGGQRKDLEEDNSRALFFLLAGTQSRRSAPQTASSDTSSVSKQKLWHGWNHFSLLPV